MASPKLTHTVTGKVHIPVPVVEQKHDYDCGPTALEAIGRYHGEVPNVRADPEQGTPPDFLIDAAKEKNYNVLARHGMTVDELRDFISNGRAVIIPIQAYGSKSQYHKADSGHYVVAIGFDDDNFYFQDPALGENRGYLPIAELDKRWHDREANGRRYDHFGIVIWKDGPPAQVDHTEEAEKISSYDLDDEPDWTVFDEEAVKQHAR